MAVRQGDVSAKPTIKSIDEGVYFKYPSNGIAISTNTELRFEIEFPALKQKRPRRCTVAMVWAKKTL